MSEEDVLLEDVLLDDVLLEDVLLEGISSEDVLLEDILLENQKLHSFTCHRSYFDLRSHYHLRKLMKSRKKIKLILRLLL